MSGFLPCFSQYKHKDYPLSSFYQNSSYVAKVKALMSSLVDCLTPKNASPPHDVQPIRNDSKEGKKLITMCGFPQQLYRIDYGNNPFRIVFSISPQEKLAYIHIIDTNHSTFRPKGKKQR